MSVVIIGNSWYPSKDDQKMRDTGQKKEELVRTLNKIVRMESFQDDFYRKPLEQMLELSDDAVRVLTQLKTTVQS